MPETNDRDTTVSNEEYRQLLMNTYILEQLLGLRLHSNGRTLIVEVSIPLLEGIIKAKLAELPDIDTYTVLPIDDWVLPTVHVGYRKDADIDENLPND